MTRDLTNPLTETSPELQRAVAAATGLPTYSQMTGGGMYVLVVALDPDNQLAGKQVWLTTEGEDEGGRQRWLLGFYDLDADDCDEGECVYLLPRTYAGNAEADAVAEAVAGILKRVRP
jgi:hypothetical protein